MYVIISCDLTSSLIQLIELSWLNNSIWFFQKYIFLECQITIVLSSDILSDFCYSRLAFLLINLIVLLANAQALRLNQYPNSVNDNNNNNALL